MTLQPPKAAQQPHKLTHHNHTRIDPYYWLNQRDSQPVLDYIHAENDYTEQVLAPVSELRDTLFEEIKGRIKQDDTSVPYRWNGYWYQTRYAEGQEYPIYVRWPNGQPDQEEVILDENVLAEGRSFCEVSDWSVSPDNQWLAYGLDLQGRRLYTLHVKNLYTGEVSKHVVQGTAGEFEWAADSVHLFYIDQEEETLRNHKLMRFSRLTGEKKEIWHEADEAFDLSIDQTKSERYLTCTAFSKTNTEVRFVAADQPEAEWQVFLPREANHEYSLDHLGDYWYITSNRQAPNFQLLRTPVDQIDRSHWEVVIPHHKDQLLEGIELFDRWLVIEERVNGLMRLRIRNWDTQEDEVIDFNEPVYTVSIHQNPEANTNILRYRYTSLTTPSSIVDYNMATHEKTLRKQQDVQGDFDADRYQSERLWAIGHDGVEIPISLVYRKDQRQDGPQPLLLYGYGSYGISMDPTFNSARLSLLDRGFVFAIAHIRGGSEMGRWWYEEEGKLLHKQNTFNDFISCAAHLIQQGFTDKQQLYALGGSAGGLLMGAVINMRPDLFRGVVGAVPFVDALTTMLDPTIPLTTQEYDEWGNPEDSTYYRYMHSYSPYDNIKEQAYPAVLAASGYHDSQVQYWEPAKWVAKLRDHHTGEAPILLHMNFEAGHGGASGRFQQFKEVALYYAFFLGLQERLIK